MKKIIITLLVLCLAGCFENSGYITKSCTKSDVANTLNTNVTYTFTFKNDIISDINVLYTYEDSNNITIKSIKSSIESQNKFLNLDYEVLNDNDNLYEIKYNIDLNGDEEILNKFMINNSRTKLVKNLKEQGFVCE